VLSSSIANERGAAQLYFKCENFQRTGAFKFRGAYNAITQFDAQQRRYGVVAFSAGNHAQGVALAARLLGVNAMVLMPSDAPAIKIAATRGYGAEVLLFDRRSGERDALLARLIEQRGLSLVPPFDHPHVMAGQGTVAKELIEQNGPLDVLLVPLGGGGLLSGCATAVAAMNPECVVIGVEPEAGDDGRRSLVAGSIVQIALPDTIADGAQTQHLGQHTFPVIQQTVREIVTVSDATLAAAMHFFGATMKMIVEPTGCLAAAAAFSGQLDLRGKRVGVVVTGGNVSLARFAALTGECD